jgi:hypothetical protein
LSRLFRPEEINGNERCPTSLHRWQIFRRGSFAVYLHRFVGDDWSLDLHDHPKRFISIGLAGGYVEETARGRREFRAPWVRSFPATHTHRVSLGRSRECWTLVIVLRASRPWGFWHGGTWIHWRDYVLGRFSHLADARAVCASIGGPDKE